MDAATTSSVKLETLIRDKTSLRTLRTLAFQLRRATVSGAEDVANATAKALRTTVSAARFTSLDELITIIRTAGAFLQDAQPKEQTIGNITRRVLHLLREEARAANLGQELQYSATDTPQYAPSTPINAAGSVSSGASTANASAAHSRAPSSSLNAAAQKLFQDLPASASGSSLSTATTPMTYAGSSSPSRPALSAFRPGSTFSISDLVAAGAGAGATSSAGASSFAASPTGSGAATPGWGNLSLDRLGYGVERLQMHSEEHEGSQNEDEQDASSTASSDEENRLAGSIQGQVPSASGGKPRPSASSNAKVYQLKPLLIQAIQELIDELETVDSNIAKDARDHVHSGEVIFTIGYSRTVEVFLKAAAKDRRFTVIVAETAPDYSGHKLAKALTLANISTLLVPDSSAFTLMPRISKILLGAHCILANGGLLASAGARMVAEAARAHSTPTVVLAGVYKVCPDWTWVGIGTSLVDRSGMTHSNITAVSSSSAGMRNSSSSRSNRHGAGFSIEGSPLDVLDLTGDEDVEVVNSVWDYVDPDMIDLLITNVGEHPVSLVYRLLSENYDPQDLVL